MRREGRITRAQLRALELLSTQYGLPASPAVLDLQAVFGRSAPIFLEIGSGDGECVAAFALANPDNDYIAVEVHRPGLGHLLNRIEALQLGNLRVANEDVLAVLARLPDEALSGVYVFFPDPWPKKRHHKRRLLQAAFFARLAPRLARHGRLFVATDSAEYAAQIVSVTAGLESWVNLAGAESAAPRLKSRPLTKFEARGLREGRTVADFVFARAALRRGD